MDWLLRRQRSPEAREVVASIRPAEVAGTLAPRDSHAPDVSNGTPLTFDERLVEHAQSQHQLTMAIGALVTNLEAMPRIAQQQAQVLDALTEGNARARQREHTLERGLAQLTEGSVQQTQVLGLVQQQLDLNHEVSLRVADSLRETASALTTFATTSDRQVRAIELLATSTQQRVKQADRLERALQFWMGVVAVISLLALIYALWAASRGPLVIVTPIPPPASAVAPSPLPASVPVPAAATVPPPSAAAPAAPTTP